MAKQTYLIPVTRYNSPAVSNDYGTIVYSVRNDGISTLNFQNKDINTAASIDPGVSDGGGTFATLDGILYFIRIKTHSDSSIGAEPSTPSLWAANDFYTIKLSTSGISPFKVIFPNAEGINNIQFVDTPNGEHIISTSRINVSGGSNISVYKFDGVDSTGTPLMIVQSSFSPSPTFKPYGVDIRTINNIIYVVIVGINSTSTGIINIYTLDTTSGTSILTLIQTISTITNPRDVKFITPSTSSEIFIAVNNGFVNSLTFVKDKGSLYRWNGLNFNDIPVFNTEDIGGGWGVETFEISGETYVLFAGYGYPTGQNVFDPYFDMNIQFPNMHSSTHLYKYNPNWSINNSSALIKIQSFDGISYKHFTFVKGDNDNSGFLFISPKQYRKNSSEGETYLFKWNAGTSRFESFESRIHRGLINSYSYQIEVNDSLLDSEIQDCTNISMATVDEELCSTTSVPFTAQFNYNIASEVLQVREFSKGSKFNLIICNRSGVQATVDIRLDTGIDPVYLVKSKSIQINETYTQTGLIATGNIKLFVISDVSGLSITCNGYSY